MSEQRKQINYAVACVIEFAKRYNMSVKNAFNFLFQYKAIEIADDDMTMLFRQFQNNMITFEMLIKGMTFKDVTSQYSFHSERAIQLLRKVGAEK